MSSKRQTTMAKFARERAVKEKRERKREKKLAKEADRARAADPSSQEDVVAESDEVDPAAPDERLSSQERPS